jgi:hypothetical protein
MGLGETLGVSHSLFLSYGTLCFYLCVCVSSFWKTLVEDEKIIPLECGNTWIWISKCKETYVSILFLDNLMTLLYVSSCK